MNTTLTIEKPSEQVALVVMKRQEKIINLSQQLLAELSKLLQTLEKDPAVRALILTGAEDVFCAGADLKLLQRLSPQGAREYLNEIIRIFSYVDSFPKATITAINGYALGGGMEMALAADFRLISETANIGLPESRLGILPGAGGVQKLTHFVGLGKALEITLLGKPLSAEEAARRGLVYKVCRSNELIPESLSLANQLAKVSPHALRSIKAIVRQAAIGDLNILNNLALDAMVDSFYTKELKEGLASFFAR